MALPRALLFLLLLSLSLLGGHPYPLGGTDGTSGLAGTQDTASEIQVTPGHHQQGGSPAGARKAQKAAPVGAPVLRDNVPKALPRLQSPKMGRDSGCFGQRLDRIGSYSGLGCNVLRRP